MVVTGFAFSSVEKEAWMRSTIRWDPLLFDWRSFSTKTCSSKDMDYWCNSLWKLPSFLLRHCFHHSWLSCSSLWTYILLHICEIFALHIQFSWHFLLGNILGCCWIIVNFCLYDLNCTYSTFVQWVAAALPVIISVFKLSLYTMIIGDFPYAITQRLGFRNLSI